MRWTFALLFVSLIQLILADGCKDTKPDFSAPDQRISEQKCREYNWQRKQIDKCSNDTANTEFPYMGFLGYKRQEKLTFLCGAFLISPKFLVSSADCITVPASTSTGFWKVEVVRLGNKHLDNDKSPLDVEVQRTIAHKLALKDNDDTEYDTGLVELKFEVLFTKSVYPGCLWVQAYILNLKNTFSPRWPKARKDSKKGNLRSEQRIYVMEMEICEKHLGLILDLTDNHICANESIFTAPDHISNPTGSGVMVTQFKLYGKTEDQMPFVIAVASTGEQSDLDVNIDIGIYCKIYSTLDWIENIVWK